MSYQAYQVSQADTEASSGGSVPYDMNSHSDPGTIRVDANGNASTVGRETYSTTDHLDKNNTHPLDNARDTYGRAVHYQGLTKDSIVQLDGTSATLEQFQSMGYAKQDSEGKWQVVNPKDIAQASQQVANQAEVDRINSLDLHPDVIENHMANLIADIPQPVYDNAIAQYAETLDINKLDVTGIAQSSGQTDDQVKSSIEFIKDSYTQQISSALGDDTDSLIQWAKNNNSQALKAATQQLLANRSLEGFKSLHKEFQSDCSTADQEHRAVNYLRSQGISVRKDGSIWIVKTDTGETSLHNAFKQGYVKWTGSSKGKK